MRLSFFIVIVLVGFTACKNKPQRAKVNTDRNAVFYDYQVWAEEDADQVTVRLQHRLGDENGPAVALEPSEKLTLDGEELQADSAGFTGFFYEVNKPLSQFAGMHRINFIDKDNQQHEEEFSFEPITLDNELPDKVKKQPFQIKLKGLSSASAKVQLVMVDTSFASKGVNEEVWIENGELQIDSSLLVNLKPGPVTMEIVKEDEKDLKNPPKDGGRILLLYRLRRQFELVD